MKRVLVAVAALTTLAAALPAAAQPWRGDDGRRGLGLAERLEWRIERMSERDQLSRREARMLHVQVDGLRRLEWRYGRDGLSQWERRDLDRRFEMLEARIRYEARDRGGRGNDRYGAGYGDQRGWR